VGAIDVVVTARDKAGEEVSDTFKVTALNTNDAPTVANAIADQTATEDRAFTFTVPDTAFADVDAPYGDTLTYTANLDRRQRAANLAERSTPPPGASSARQPTGDVGSFEVLVTATDKAGRGTHRHLPGHRR
jgi:hypothetical protein